MLTILCSPTYQPEREYICQALLKKFLGLDYILQFQERCCWRIAADDNSELILPDILFQTPQKKWLSPESLSAQPLASLDVQTLGLDCPLVDQKIPIIFGGLDASLELHRLQGRQDAKSFYLPIDIFGSSFFMLSRYEEVVIKERDEHGRFPAWASLALQEGFLDRPIVNEYLEILWAAMKKLWPGLVRKERFFQMKVTCDVDHVYQESLKKPFRHLKTIGGDLIRRKNPFLAVKSTVNFFAAKVGNYSFDPNLSAIDWIMEVNEKAGNRMTFFVKAGCTNRQYDSSYSLYEPVVRKLLRRIHKRGHSIGLHPSYNTYCDREQLTAEATSLRRVLEQENIVQDKLGSRQHYLRWDAAQTPVILEQACIDYDTTLSFADHSGFRCGVCYEFPLYNLKQRRVLKVQERPLVVMECSLLSKNYMNIKKQDFIQYFEMYNQEVRLFDGEIVFLWHNSFFNATSYYRVYADLIS